MKDFPEMEKLFQVKFQQRVKVYSLFCWLELARTCGLVLGRATCSRLCWQTDQSSILQRGDERSYGGRSTAAEKQDQTSIRCAPGVKATPRAGDPDGWVIGLEDHSSGPSSFP